MLLHYISSLKQLMAAGTILNFTEDHPMAWWVYKVLIANSLHNHGVTFCTGFCNLNFWAGKLELNNLVYDSFNRVFGCHESSKPI